MHSKSIKVIIYQALEHLVRSGYPLSLPKAYVQKAGHRVPTRNNAVGPVAKKTRLVTIRLAWGKQGLVPCKPTPLAGTSTMCNVYVEKGGFPIPCSWKGHDWMLTLDALILLERVVSGSFAQLLTSDAEHAPLLLSEWFFAPLTTDAFWIFWVVMKHIPGMILEIATSIPKRSMLMQIWHRC